MYFFLNPKYHKDINTTVGKELLFNSFIMYVYRVDFHQYDSEAGVACFFVCFFLAKKVF